MNCRVIRVVNIIRRLYRTCMYQSIHHSSEYSDLFVYYVRLCLLVCELDYYTKSYANDWCRVVRRGTIN